MKVHPLEGVNHRLTGDGGLGGGVGGGGCESDFGFIFSGIPFVRINQSERTVVGGMHVSTRAWELMNTQHTRIDIITIHTDPLPFLKKFVNRLINFIKGTFL